MNAAVSSYGQARRFRRAAGRQAMAKGNNARKKETKKPKKDKDAKKK